MDGAEAAPSASIAGPSREISDADLAAADKDFEAGMQAFRVGAYFHTYMDAVRGMTTCKDGCLELRYSLLGPCIDLLSSWGASLTGWAIFKLGEECLF